MKVFYQIKSNQMKTEGLEDEGPCDQDGTVVHFEPCQLLPKGDKFEDKSRSMVLSDEGFE
jgi:hypothetical protein